MRTSLLLMAWVAGLCTHDAALSALMAGQPADSPPTTTDARDGALLPSPRERLESLAAQQGEAPVEAAKAAPAPPGLEAALQGGPSEADAARPEAREALDAVLDRFIAMAIESATPPVAAPNPPTDAEAFAATRLYVMARQKFLDDDFTGALTDTEAAVALDPGAPSLWVALGEIRLRSGQDQAGIDAMRRAVALGLEHPRPLLLIAARETTHGTPDAAIHHGARAVRASGMEDDPALPHMAWATLGDALLRGGYLRAAGDAHTRAFDLPANFPSETQYTGEISSMYRAQWDAAFQAGLLATAAQDWEIAARAFSICLGSRSVDEIRVLPPLVNARMRMGQPARAALDVLQAIESRGAAADERSLRLIRYLKDKAGVGPMLAAALTEFDSHARGRSPSIETSLARAVAAGLPDGLDRGPLAEAFDRFPNQPALARELLESFGEGERERALDVACQLAERHSVYAQIVGDAMILAGLRTPAVLDALVQRPRGVGRDLLLARLLLETADHGRARGVLIAGEHADSAAGQPAGDATAISALDAAAARRYLSLQIETAAGDTAAARRVIDSWPTPTTAGERLLLVMSLRAINDLTAAADAAGEPEMPAEGWDTDSRVLLAQAAQIARARGQHEQAERLANRLIESDPYSEEGYGVIIAMQTSGAATANQQTLAHAVRELRENVPTSPLLRYLSSRELAQAGRLDDADARLRALAEDHPSDDSVLRALNEVWSQRGVREGMGTLDGAEAFLARLSAANPTTLAPPTALALLRLTRDRPAEAVGAIGAWLDRGLLATAEDRMRLQMVVDTLQRRVGTDAASPSRGPLLGLWDRMDAAGIALSVPMHSARITVLTLRPPFDDAAIIAAATRAADQVDSLDPMIFMASATRVVPAGRHDLAFALMRAGAAREAGLRPEDTARWAALIAQQGTGSDLRDLLDLTRDPTALNAILRAMPTSPDVAPTDPARLKADVAYAISGAVRILDRPEETAESFLELALELFPEHENAANDLGYHWADRGVRLADAELLLEMAARLRPGESNVIDSLGWLRYKQGRLTDTLDDAGQPVPGGEGAVTLLQQAAAGLAETAGPVTQDQLGDALWRAGRRDEALEAWRSALPRAQRTVEAYTTGGAPPRMLGDAQARRDAIHVKIVAVESQIEPQVAPLGEGVAEAR